MNINPQPDSTQDGNMVENRSSTLWQRLSLFKPVRMLARLGQPHISITEPGERRQASVLAWVTLIFLSLNLLGMVIAPIFNPDRRLMDSTFWTVLVLNLFAVLVYGLARSPYYRAGGLLIVAGLSLLGYYSLTLGYHSDSSIGQVVEFYFLLPILIGAAVLSYPALVVISLANIIFIMITPLLNPAIPAREVINAGGFGMISTALLLLILGVRNAVERDRLAELRQSNRELGELRNALERRVAARTRALQTSASVSRHLSAFLDPGELLNAVVEDLQRAFDYYFVQVYLWDDESQSLRLASGSGAAGQAMLQAGHQVAAGRGLVGRAAQSRHPVFVADTTADPGWLANSLLPETRCEAAIPILGSALADADRRVLGVLDVQHKRIGGLDEESLDLLQSIADQLAIALQNAASFGEQAAVLQQLRESEERFRAIFEGSNDAVQLLDEKGFFDANRRTLELFGVDSLDEFRRLTPVDLSPAQQADERDSTQAAMAYIQQAFQTGGARFEWLHKRSDGRVFPAEVLLSAFDYGKRRVLQATVRDISERMAVRQALQRQIADLRKVSQISALVATTLDPTELLQRSCDQVKADFGFYHAQVYLLNSDRDALELAAGAGQVGQKMVSRGWSIALESQRSLVVRAARERRGTIVNDVRSEAGFLRNPLLPDTAAEMAVPLMAGDELLGVFDLQSEQAGRFSEADVAIQATLAAQLAVALQNARQYQQTLQSERLVRSIIDASPDWIFVKDSDHRYLLVNKAYADRISHSVDELIGKTDLDVGFSEEAVRGDPARGIQGFWSDDDQVLSSGQVHVTPFEVLQVAGEERYYSTIKVPLFDDNGDTWGVLGFVRDITDRERLRQRTEEQLREVDAVYRAMSREAWQSFYEERSRHTSFVFDHRAVEAADLDTSPDWAGHSVPLATRGTVIGALAVEAGPEKPLSTDEIALLDEMSDQVAQALESARLFEQTQTALAATEILYAGSEGVVRSTSLKDVLASVIEATALHNFQRGSLLLFDSPWQEQTPETGTIMAAWQSGGLEKEEPPIGIVYPLRSMPFTSILSRSRPLFVADIAGDPHLDAQLKAMLSRLGATMAVFPLVAADQWIGWIAMFGDQALALSEAQLRQVQSLIGQAAAVVQSLLLLEQSQARARYERILREVTARLRGSSDPDAVMRRAVREVGEVLGRDALIRIRPAGVRAPAAIPSDKGGNNGGHRPGVAPSPSGSGDARKDSQGGQP